LTAKALGLAWRLSLMLLTSLMWLTSCTSAHRSEAQLDSSTSNVVTAARRPSTLGVVVDKEMRVVALDRGGAAAAAGVQIGDQLISLNGVAFASGRDAIRAALPNLGGNLANDVIAIGEDGAEIQSDPQPVPAQIVGQADVPVEKATATPVVRVDPQVTIVVQRNGQAQSLNLDLSIYPYYDILPTPTAMPPDAGLLYF